MKRFIPFVTLLLFMAGCQLLASTELTEEAAKYEKNHEIIGEEKAEIIGEIHPDIFKPALVTDKIDEGNILEIDNLSDRPYQVPTGRYEIYVEGTGYVYLYDENDDLVYREYVGYGIETIEVDIYESYDFRFNALEYVRISEIKPEIKNEFTSGVYEVGTHIKPGTYEVSGQGFGYMKVLSEEEQELYELTESAFTKTVVNIVLEEGQKVIISGLPLVVLEEIET